jgi:hypothetical protein
VDLEEELQDVAVGDLGGVEDDLDPFGMSAVVAVGGIGHITPRVADARADHAGHAPDQVLHPPEAAACENRRLMRVRHIRLRASCCLTKMALRGRNVQGRGRKTS